MKNKKGIDISLNTFVELILAVIAIIVLNVIIFAVINIYTSQGSEEEYSINGLIALQKNIEQYEKEDFGDKFTVNTYVEDDMVMVAFPRNKKKIEGECRNTAVVKDSRIINMFRSDTIELEVERPDTCDSNLPCLCLCEEDFSDNRISCEKASICSSFSGESNRNLDFKGHETCDIPLIYPSSGQIAKYCAKKQDDGWTFVPESC